MELAGDIIHSLANFLGLEDLSMHYKMFIQLNFDKYC